MNLEPFSSVDAARVQDFFTQSGYDEAHVRDVQPTGIPPSLRPCDLESYETRLGAWTAFHCLTKWFFLGAPVSREACRGVIPDWFIDLCVGHGLLRLPPAEEGSLVTPGVLVTPCEDVWIASDLHQQRRSNEAGDHILPLNRPARHLCRFLIRDGRGKGLDLCSGNGLHATLLGEWCAEVSTADLSPRSEIFCRFNAALNGRAPYDCHTGDRYAPVAGRKFDFIVCNPPFVITPGGEMKYHANTMELDGFCRELIRSTPAHLEEGGLCQMLSEWVEIPGQPWRERLETWWEGLGCDVWIILANTQKPESYARTRSLDAELTAEEQTRREEAWRLYLNERNVSAVHGGIITLRRRAAESHWRRIDELTEAVERPAGEAMARIMACEDFLQKMETDEALMNWRPRLSPGARLDQTCAWDGEDWEPSESILRLDPPLTAPIRVQEPVLTFLTWCQGKKTLGTLIEDLARVGRLAPGVIRPHVVETLRQLVQRGLVLP